MFGRLRSLARRVYIAVDYLRLIEERLSHIDQRLPEIGTHLTPSLARIEERLTNIETRNTELSIHVYQIADRIEEQRRASPPHNEEELSFGDYSYVPAVRPWAATRAGKRMMSILQNGDSKYLSLLTQIAQYGASFEAIPVEEPRDSMIPHWENGWFPGLDAISLYGLIVLEKPNRYIEIGSGNSTKFARRAINDHGLATKIVSIDPFPRAEIDELCDEVIRRRCEDVDPSFYEGIGAGDILFVDNSHRSFQNSDVTVFFTEILPSLPRGVIVGIHDIFLPEDYPKTWLKRHYNEQYLLASYIFAGMAGGEILLPNAYVQKSGKHMSALAPVFSRPALRSVGVRGGAFWLRT